MSSFHIKCEGQKISLSKEIYHLTLLWAWVDLNVNRIVIQFNFIHERRSVPIGGEMMYFIMFMKFLGCDALKRELLMSFSGILRAQTIQDAIIWQCLKPFHRKTGLNSFFTVFLATRRINVRSFHAFRVLLSMKIHFPVPLSVPAPIH